MFRGETCSCVWCNQIEKGILHAIKLKIIQNHDMYLFLLGEIFLAFFRIWLDGVSTRGPICRAHFTVLICKFECLQQTESLINGTSHWQVIHCFLTKDTFWRDDKEATKSDTSIVTLFNQDLVVLGDGFGDVSDERVLETAKTSFVARGVDPAEVREGRVDAGTEDLYAEGLEFFDAVAECDDLSGTNECPIEGVEEEHDVSVGGSFRKKKKIS